MDVKLRENDGSGVGIKTRNSVLKTVCTTERLGYYPTYGEQLFNTDLNKAVICIAPESKKWVDMMGETV